MKLNYEEEKSGDFSDLDYNLSPIENNKKVLSTEDIDTFKNEMIDKHVLATLKPEN